MGHLDSQRSLPVIGEDRTSFSPMATKLRLAEGHSAAILKPPPDYLALLSPGPAGIRTELEPARQYDVVQLFVKDAGELRRLGPAAIRAIKPEGMLWITYPKGGATRGATDLAGHSVVDQSATCWARSRPSPGTSRSRSSPSMTTGPP